MFHQGQTGAIVSLDTLLPDPTLYAIGALADLAGEITVVAGRAYVSYPDGATATRTEVGATSPASASLLVAAQVPLWTAVITEQAISFAELDKAIPRLAAIAGLDTAGRFPFLVEGTFADLAWHVIDGTRLTAGGNSHQDHLAAAVTTRLERATGTLLGFYSTTDGGVFTHMGSATHVHATLDKPLATGHVDAVTIPAGTTVRFPAPSD